MKSLTLPNVNDWAKKKLLTLLILNAGWVFSAGAVSADTWVCMRPGQADLYTDHGGPGCRKLEEVKSFSQSPISQAPGLPPSAAAPPPAPITTPAIVPAPQNKKPRPFPDVTLRVPIVAVSPSTVQPPTSSIKIHVLHSWVGYITKLTVGYLTSGAGPEIMPDSNMGPVIVRSLETAVAAAAQAVGFDPKFLKVRLLVPSSSVDGPSAGGMFAVGIAAALLGDQIRPDVCMSGTIEKSLEVKPVGRLEDKISACQNLKKREMIVPFGLVTMDLALKGASKEIKIIEVHTLAEAYQAATGQSLRTIPVN